MDLITAGMISEAYHDIQDENTPTKWFVLKYAGEAIMLDSAGEDYEIFKSKFSDTDRCVGYFREVLADGKIGCCLLYWTGPRATTFDPKQELEDINNIKQMLSLQVVDIMVKTQSDLEYGNVVFEIIKAHNI